MTSQTSLLCIAIHQAASLCSDPRLATTLHLHPSFPFLDGIHLFPSSFLLFMGWLWTSLNRPLMYEFRFTGHPFNWKDSSRTRTSFPSRRRTSHETPMELRQINHCNCLRLSYTILTLHKSPASKDTYLQTNQTQYSGFMTQ